jgi:hypothetical protein
MVHRKTNVGVQGRAACSASLWNEMLDSGLRRCKVNVAQEKSDG